jgi:hypothetical protein
MFYRAFKIIVFLIPFHLWKGIISEKGKLLIVSQLSTFQMDAGWRGGG